MNIEKLGLQIDSPLVHPGAQNFRPPTWPPPPGWAPILDAQGAAQCHYSDSSWPLDVWAGRPLKINFGDGATKGAHIDTPNADVLRACTIWWLWGPRGCRTAAALSAKHSVLKPIFVVCSENGINACNIVRFPRVIDKVAKSLAPSSFGDAVTYLHELLAVQETLGFRILDEDGIARLVKLAPDHEKEQTPYIPSRIWTYQVIRLRECLSEYLANRDKVEACFEFCCDAYTKNFGSLKRAVNVEKSVGSRTPFQNRPRCQSKGCVYHGAFKDTADCFGLTPLIERWVKPFTCEKSEKGLVMFSQYLDLVSKVGVAYLLNFSLMRIKECWDLRSDCLLVEHDEKFGDIHLLCDETTKTDPDADARWPVSKSAELAVEAMKHIAGLRMRCARERDGIGLTQDHCCPINFHEKRSLN